MSYYEWLLLYRLHEREIEKQLEMQRHLAAIPPEERYPHRRPLSDRLRLLIPIVYLMERRPALRRA